jgi:hypothetical protein
MKLLCRLFILVFIYFCANSFLYAASDDLESIPRLVQEMPILAFESFGEARNSNTTLLEVNPGVLTDLSGNRLNKVAIPVGYGDVIFEKSFQKTRSKTSTWIGKEDEGNASVVLTIGSDHFFGRVVTDDHIIVFEPGQISSQVISTVMDPAYEISVGQDEIIAPQPAQEFFTAMEPSDDGTRIDMMVLYTNGMAMAYPGTLIDTRIQYLIDLSNASFANSNIDTAFNLVYSQEVIYPDDSPGDMGEALNDLRGNNGVFIDVENLRTIYGADQVTLLRRFVDEACGLAYVLTSDNARYAYAVVHDGSKTDGSGYYCSELTYAHEIGHNLGCAHDRANAGVAGRFSYSYGYQQVPGYQFRTVMAYNCPGGCPRINYFSNPNVMFEDIPTGVADPDENSADNALTINQTRVGMAGYRAAVSIAVTAPNNSEQWASGTSKTITWTSANITDDVTIELYHNGIFDSTISPQTPNTGSYVWDIPLTQPFDSNYRIRISSTSFPDIFDESDGDFSITETSTPPGSMPWINLLLILEN